MAGFDISKLKGTPLYQLATNANVYGGRTLSKTEMTIFQQQCREMGFSPEKYGLEIETEDLESANAKETRKNQEEIRSKLDNAYKDQFGKKNIEVAKDAETKAYAIIYTAKEAFERTHKGVNFVPDSLGQRPNFMSPEYKDNLVKYVSDLNAWGARVAEEYRNADSMTNEQLAAMIMLNDNENTQDVVETTVGVGLALGEKIDDSAEETQAVVRQEGEAGRATVRAEGAKTRNAVHAEGAATRATVRTEGTKTRNVVRAESAKIQSTVKAEGVLTRATVEAEGILTRADIEAQGIETRAAVEVQGIETRSTVQVEGIRTRANTDANAERIIDTLDPLGRARAIKWVRDKAADAGRSVVDFIKENPTIIISPLGVPLAAASKLFE